MRLKKTDYLSMIKRNSVIKKNYVQGFCVHSFLFNQMLYNRNLV